MSKSCFLFLFFSLLCVSVLAQIKIEKEYSVTPKQVPVKALAFMQKLSIKNRIKWYGEESHTGKSFEAKTKYQGKRYSMEFSEKGIIEDVEVTIRFKKLPLKIQRAIKKSLAKRFIKFRIKKVQLQYTGSETDLMKQIKGMTKLLPKYELVLKGKKAGPYCLYEFLFSNNGSTIESELKFAPDNFENLEY